MISRFLARFGLGFLLILAAFPGWVQAQDGFGGNATGGAGGRTVQARSEGEFLRYIGMTDPLIIEVEGEFSIGLARIRSNKTVVGVGRGATLRGTLIVATGSENVIVRNVTFTNPMNKKGKGGGDGISIRGGKRVWIGNCTFRDCGDGALDVTENSDYVTVAWCKFFYTKQPEHRFVMLTSGREGKKHKNKIKVTLHHNWFGEKCDQRMPAARKAMVHMYNNYFSCHGNSYCTNIRRDAELLSESNYYDKVQNPCYGEDGGKIRVHDNIYKDCTGKIDSHNDDVFKPPYKWKLDSAKKVPDLVRAKAGAR